MLVLSRRRDEGVSCVLPDGRTIRIVVCSVDGPKVRLGFEAPRDIVFVRDNAIRRHGRPDKEAQENAERI